MSSNQSQHKNVLGIIIIVIGFLLLVDQLHLIRFGNILSMWWPMILVLLGLAQFQSNKKSGTLLIVVGAIFQLNAFDFLDWNIWNILWPVLIILFGFSLLTGTRHEKNSPPTNPSDENRINSFNMFSGLKRAIISQHFAGGQITTVFGGAEIDLRGAASTEKEILLNVTALFGGVDIAIGNHWKIVMSGTPLFGGMDDTRGQKEDTPEGTPILKIYATVLFGGLEIK